MCSGACASSCTSRRQAPPSSRTRPVAAGIGLRTSALRFAVGIGCVAAAAWLFVAKVPQTVRSLNGTVASYAGIGDDDYRSMKVGAVLGIPRDLQEHALAQIPPGSTYAVLLPESPAFASSAYGIAEITYDTVGPFLNYLLLPSVQVPSDEARYVICWGCDTDPWDHRTTWLFTDPQGVAIGRVSA